MANLNINRSVSDAFYRYKMPRLLAKVIDLKPFLYAIKINDLKTFSVMQCEEQHLIKAWLVEGKGNGIKTVIVNMSDVAKALCRPPTYPTKYFGCELGAQTQFDSKNDRFIVNGSHDSSKLQDLLDGFIRKFVLCPECENPETNLIVQAKKGIILQRCIACGHQANIDMRHKLTTFILKNPPEPDSISSTNNTTTTNVPTAAPTSAKKKDRRNKGKDSASTENGNGDSGSMENNHERTTPPLKKDEEDDWCEDTSAAAVKARMEALSGAAKTMTISDDLEKSPQERVDIFYSFVKQRKVAGELAGPEREKEIVTEADRLEIRDQAALVLVEVLYDANILDQIKQYRSLMCRLTHDNTRAQRYLLGAFEQLVGTEHRDVLLPKVPHILKAFYECDIVDESVLIEWDEKPIKKYMPKEVTKEVSKEIHTRAAPLIKWLKEAEEETSEDDGSDSDEEDVDVVYEDNGSNKIEAKSAPRPAPVAINATVCNGDNDGEDVDIDAI